MKKLLFAGMVLAGVLAFVGCGDDSKKQEAEKQNASPGISESQEVTSVKNAILGYDKSRTIETALKARCSSLEWKSGVSDDGRKFVEVYGVWKDTAMKHGIETRKVLPNAPYWYESYAKNVSLLPDDIIHVQFLLNADGTIELYYGAFCTPDRSVKRAKHEFGVAVMSTDKDLEMERLLKTIYQGKHIDHY